MTVLRNSILMTDLGSKLSEITMYNRLAIKFYQALSIFIRCAVSKIGIPAKKRGVTSIIIGRSISKIRVFIKKIGSFAKKSESFTEKIGSFTKKSRSFTKKIGSFTKISKRAVFLIGRPLIFVKTRIKVRKVSSF